VGGSLAAIVGRKRGIMRNFGKLCLLLAGLSSSLIALIHVIIIIIGEPTYRSLEGVGEELANMLISGSIIPTLITLLITLFFIIFAVIGFSGAKIITRLPLLRTGIIIVATIYLLRGLINLPYYSIIIAYGQMIENYKSIILDSVSLLIGLFYLVGLILEWNVLSNSQIVIE